MTDALALTWRQYRLERKMFWRNPSAAFFNFVLPLLFLFLFGAIFSSSQEDLDIIVPGIAGMSVMSTTFVALAMNMVFLREQGVLKRLRGTPLPSGAYLGGLAAHAITNTAIQLSFVIAAGALLFDVGLPANWLMLARLRRRRRRVPRLARRRAVARDPELRLRPGLRQRDLPAGDRHQRRLLRRRLGARVHERHRPGAAAHAPHRGPVGGDGHRRAVRRPSLRSRRRRDLAALGALLAVRGFSSEAARRG